VTLNRKFEPFSIQALKPKFITLYKFRPGNQGVILGADLVLGTKSGLKVMPFIQQMFYDNAWSIGYFQRKQPLKTIITEQRIWITLLLFQTTVNASTEDSEIVLSGNRDIQSVTAINSELVNANLQAILVYVQKIAIRSFIHASMVSCKSQNNLINNFITGILGNRPHLVIRKLLKQEYLFARNTETIMEAFPCTKVKDFRTLAMKVCSSRVPIEFHISGKKSYGFLDPVDNIIYKNPMISACSLVNNILISVNNKTFLYNKSGNLTLITSVKNLSLNTFLNTIPLEFENTPIFKQLILFQNSEL
jgi:hypothetical protein